MIQKLSLPARLTLAFGLLGIVAVGGVVMTHRPDTVPTVIRVTTVDELQQAFSRYDYSLSAARQTGTVPPLAISDVPAGWEVDLDTSQRKQVFFESVLPLVLLANENVERDRRRLGELSAALNRGETLDRKDRKWLEKLAIYYEVEWPQTDDATKRKAALAALRHRVGPVPPSLALSQAAVESAYGTSRFATSGNALFGQWTRGDGLKPEKQRASKADWTVARFASPLRSVESYLRNLNTHNAYRDFRRQRQASGGAFSGAALAGTLASYSEKGAEYTRMLRDIIRVNGLDALDRTRLADLQPVRLLLP